MEGSKITYTASGKRQFAPNDHVFPLSVIHCSFYLYKQKLSSSKPVSHVTKATFIWRKLVLSRRVTLQGLFFTSGHRPAQRDMCTNGTQVPCEVPSLPNPTTRKGWPYHRGLRDYVPYSFRTVVLVLLRSSRTDQCKCCETGPTVFRPYPQC